jgi:hypothetical protein
MAEISRELRELRQDLRDLVRLPYPLFFDPTVFDHVYILKGSPASGADLRMKKIVSAIRGELLEKKACEPMSKAPLVCCWTCLPSKPDDSELDDRVHFVSPMSPGDERYKQTLCGINTYRSNTEDNEKGCRRIVYNYNLNSRLAELVDLCGHCSLLDSLGVEKA